ncbi:hypothetical protein HWV62_35079 [Athelia sp. TMB]|nr:hypothetical protein HWV62_35079 [Athelia sp. TMB]
MSSQSQPSSPGPPPASKRGFSEVLENLRSSQKKNKKSKTLDPYVTAGKHLCRGIDPFMDVSTIFYFALAKASLEAGDESQKVVLDTLDKSTQDSYYSTYQKITAVIPNFVQRLTEFEDFPDELEMLISKACHGIKKASLAVRQNDTSHLKEKVIKYLLPDPGRAVEPSIGTTTVKADRGFSHRVTALLLCPARFVADLENDYHGYVNFSLSAVFSSHLLLTSTISKIHDGRIPVIAEDYPNFLFSKFNKDDIEEGLLRGFLLVRVYKHIFTGPSSAFKTATTRKINKRRDNAALSKLTQVTPITIAYAAIQASGSFQPRENWSENDGEFSMVAFFKVIVNMFAQDSEWATETLRWWNMQIFGVQHSPPIPTETDQNNAPPTLQDTLAAQRKAKADQQANANAISASDS